MTKAVPSLLAAGLVLLLLELLLTLLRGHSLFLSGAEVLSYVLSASLSLTSAVVGVGLVLWSCRRHKLIQLGVVFGAAGGFAWVGFLLTQGRRVRDLWWRPALVLVAGLVAALLLHALLRLLERLRESGSGRARMVAAMACFVAAASCLVADALVLPRGYPAFHWSLLVLALVCAAAGGLVLEQERPPSVIWGSLGLLLVLAVSAPFSLSSLAAQPNTSFVVSEKAPFTAKLMRPFTVRAAPDLVDGASEPPPSEGEAAATRIDLRDRDILLITVDALRADTLRALGGNGLTPEIDRLAEQGTVFRRAYTPAPHTSYALASLLTAKFIKPVVELGTGVTDHTTLPDLLRRYGYRTAAFYPPAIFFVDGARFEALSARGFGFEYRKEMFASADTRVAQLDEYLGESSPEHPLFVWVHLFEPHEPYAPPAAFMRDDTARGRYDGEVAYSDAAIGRLVRSFMSARPRAAVVISADHGEEFGDHGGSFHGSTLYDEQVRVPLVWFAPDVIAKGVSDLPVELVDVGSTLLSALGIPRDPRMRGDDLGAALAGEVTVGPRFAFASVDERHMVCDGRHKAMCSVHEQHCQLFDLSADPKEQHNLAVAKPELVDALRRELFTFLGSIARREALAVDQGVGFPEPLARARLSAPGAGPDVVPLLGDERAAVRAASARVLGELGIEAAAAPLAALLAKEPEAAVRNEAAIASLMLGNRDAKDAVLPLLAHPERDDDGLSLRRRAALALATLPEPRAAPVLGELALDASAQEGDRVRAVQALGQLSDEAAVRPLVEALRAVRLRESAAIALGNIGGPEAANALLAQLQVERYPPARFQEASVLLKLGDLRVVPALARFLGMETSVPGGVRLLLEAGQLKAPGPRGASVLSASTRRGSWSCDQRACSPGPGARLLLPASAASTRVTLLIDGEPGATVSLDDTEHALVGGEQQVSFVRPRGGPLQLSVGSEAQVAVLAWVAFPVTEELPPPKPEPWDAGSAAP